MAARGAALLRLYERYLPELIPVVADHVRTDRAGSGGRPTAPYEGMPPRDVSRDLLTPAVVHLRVVRVPHCGWSDLGTPARLHHWQVWHGALRSAPTARSA
jgi:mannose-1-phosphate guanylyltransferase